MSIYLPCDIRGHAHDQLTPELYRRWGIALGMQVDPGAKFLVGGDTRASTGPFLEALVDGLARTGVDCVNVGQLPTPMIYYGLYRLRAEACAIVTASHNAADTNGLKWMIGDCPPSPEDIAAMAEAVDDGEPATRGRKARAARTLDVTFDYVANLQETFVDSMGAQLHIVVDPLYGAWAGRARRYLHAIFPQCLFTTIHDKTDPCFGGLTPDCSKVDNLHELTEAVFRVKADLGVAFDGDGDRLAIVDNEGMLLSPEEAVWVLIESLGAKLRGQRVVCDLKFSDRIAESLREHGAEPLGERSGHAFVRARMCTDAAMFGAEVSGHYFYQALGGGDDALYSTCHLIAFLAQCGARLSDLRGRCPRVYITPELRVEVSAEMIDGAIATIRRQWSTFPQSTLDGVRIDTPGGWILARRSITEPVLKFRFESIDFDGLHALVERFCASLPEIGPRLSAAYHDAMGMCDNP